ncbi:MAG: LCP family glycopolymer transferase [Gaiellales bacterium]
MKVYSGSGSEPPKEKKRRPRWKRILYWSLGVILVVVLAAGGGLGYWLYTQYRIVTHTDPAVSRASKDLAGTGTLPIAKKPAIALVIGSDHRYTDGSAPPRSDTLMLVRIDPVHHLVSLLSIPRDLYVPVPGLGMSKINAAFSEGKNGAKVALQTVETVTGVHPQYLAVVNFQGFKNLVNDIGGVYIPVDENYQHSNAGQPPDNIYSEIHIAPGYQKLDGANALGFARYRHTDSDFYRNARQQLFLHLFEQAAANRFHGISITDLPTIISVIGDVAHNAEITGKNGAPSLSTFKDYATLLYSLHGRILSVRFKGVQTQTLTDGESVVTDTNADIKNTVYQFLHPWKIKQPGGQLPKQHKPHTKKFKPAVDPSSVKVRVLNGTKRAHLAGKTGAGLSAWGYTETDGNAPTSTFTRTWVFYQPGKRNAARDLAKIVGAGTVVPLPARFAHKANVQADVTVVLGPNYSGKLAIPAPKAAPPPKLPADMTQTQDYLSEFRTAAHAAHLPGLYPAAIPNASIGELIPFTYTEPIRFYNIPAAGNGPNSMYAYFQYNGIAGSYWGIEETRFVNAPILQSPSASRVINGHRFLFFFNGAHISMVAQIDNVHHVVYWVQNTLMNDLSNPDMIAIARSLAPTG